MADVDASRSGPAHFLPRRHLAQVATGAPAGMIEFSMGTASIENCLQRVQPFSCEFAPDFRKHPFISAPPCPDATCPAPVQSHKGSVFPEISLSLFISDKYEKLEPSRAPVPP
jgi:hypothetical protein